MFDKLTYNILTRVLFYSYYRILQLKDLNRWRELKRHNSVRTQTLACHTRISRPSLIYLLLAFQGSLPEALLSARILLSVTYILPETIGCGSHDCSGVVVSGISVVSMAELATGEKTGSS